MPTPFAASAAGIDMEVADLGRALAAAIAALGPAREQVAAVGIAGLAESGAPLRAGRPLAPIIAWHDGRGEETVASLEQRFGPALARWTGRRVRTVSSMAKLGWLVDHGLPDPDRWLGVPELVLFLLTGAEATEHSLAARTGAYDVIERRFLPDVIAHVLLRATGRPVGRQGRRGSARTRHPGGSSTNDRRGPLDAGRPADGERGLFPPVLAAGRSWDSSRRMARRVRAPGSGSRSRSPGTTIWPPPPASAAGPTTCSTRWARPRRWSAGSTPPPTSTGLWNSTWP